MAAAPPVGEPAKSDTVEGLVFRGHIQTTEGSFGPGSLVRVATGDLPHLKAAGAVRPDDYEAPAEIQNGKLSVVAADGPQIGVAFSRLGMA